MEAAIAEAKAKADAAAQQALNWCASEIAKVDADLAIARQETQKRVVDAQTRRAAMIAEAEGQVAAEVAQVKAEIERQKARALQVKRQLDADVVQLAEADRQGQRGAGPRPGRASSSSAGKAEAEALQARGRGLQGQPATRAREVLALQQVIPLLAEVAGARRSLRGPACLGPARRRHDRRRQPRPRRDRRQRADQGRDRPRSTEARPEPPASGGAAGPGPAAAASGEEARGIGGSSLRVE